VDWRKKLVESDKYRGELAALKEQVEDFAAQFPMPGFEDF
jgi:hypothetical protein